MPVYAREQVQFVWLVEPLQRTLEVFQLQAGRWAAVGSYEGRAGVRAGRAFDAIELELGSLGADIRRH